MNIKIGDKIFLNPLFCLTVIIFSLIDGVFCVFFILLAAILHELGHILAAIICKGKIKTISVLAIGARIEFDNKKFSYKNESFVAFSGPLFNFLTVVILLMLKSPLENFTYYYLFLFANILLMIINLIPVMPLDGGRILNSLMLCIFEIEKASLISDIISLIVLIPMFFCGFWILYITKYNFTVILIMIYLLIILFKKNFKEKVQK